MDGDLAESSLPVEYQGSKSGKNGGRDEGWRADARAIAHKGRSGRGQPHSKTLARYSEAFGLGPLFRTARVTHSLIARTKGGTAATERLNPRSSGRRINDSDHFRREPQGNWNGLTRLARRPV